MVAGQATSTLHLVLGVTIVASYKDGSKLFQSTSTEFDSFHKPGETPPHSGIYRCQGCGVEIVAEEARSFPPTRACTQHHPSGIAGDVRWKLLVYADHAGS